MRLPSPIKDLNPLKAHLLKIYQYLRKLLYRPFNPKEAMQIEQHDDFPLSKITNANYEFNW